MVNLFWNIYGWVYDAALLELIPYQNMLRLTGEALAPRNGELIFDAGCGTGNLLARLTGSNKKLSLVGADSSPVMLKRATIKLAGSRSPVTLLQLDLNDKLPFESDTFNAAACINVLYILDQPVLLLKELHRVLKKNGRLIIATPLNEPKLVPVLNEHIETLKARYPRTWVTNFTAQAFRVFIPASISIFMNLVITRNNKYLFYKREDLESLIKNNGYQIQDEKIIYGGQLQFIIAEKC